MNPTRTNPLARVSHLASLVALLSLAALASGCAYGNAADDTDEAVSSANAGVSAKLPDDELTCVAPQEIVVGETLMRRTPGTGEARPEQGNPQPHPWDPISPITGNPQPHPWDPPGDGPKPRYLTGTPMPLSVP